MRPFLTVLAAVALLGGLAAGLRSVKVNTQNGRFVDELGRERLFHGSNVVYKGPPYHPVTDSFNPFTSFSEEDAQFFKQLGLNVIRLAVMWPGVEPMRGVYNETYLNVFKGIVETAAKYDLNVVIECHQDMLSEKFCGEGVPLWAVNIGKPLAGFPAPYKPSFPKTESGIPTKENCDLYDVFLYQLTYEAAHAYQAIYSNTDGLGDAFAKYWAKLAQTFKDYNNVIGYEIINEPFAGDIFKNPTLLLPGVADRKNIGPLHERVAAEIRKVDDEKIIIFSTVTWDDFIPAGYSQVPGGKKYADRSVLAYHYYKSVNFNQHVQTLSRLNDAKRLGNCGTMLTEYETFPGESEKMVKQLDIADEFLQSWMNWEYKAYFPITGWNYGFYQWYGGVNEAAVRAASRTYAHATAGSIQKMRFDAETGRFALSYNSNPGDFKNPAETEIYLNEAFNYPFGFKVTVSPADFVQWYQPSENKVHVVTKFTGKVEIVIEACTPEEQASCSSSSKGSVAPLLIQ